jgi:putative RNA 2'-phosphotransferase
MSKAVVSASKFMSLVLRHQPDIIGLTLDANGWAEIDDLIRLSQAQHPLDRALIEYVVATNNKQRFAISDDGQRIRARQGHSIDVDLGFAPRVPSDWLFHGTATRFLDSIRREGLSKQRRQHVHLSADADTAKAVGSRHGAPVVLRIRAGAMAAAGYAFYRSDNGVWLTDAVPVDFIVFDDECV